MATVGELAWYVKQWNLTLNVKLADDTKSMRVCHLSDYLKLLLLVGSSGNHGLKREAILILAHGGMANEGEKRKTFWVKVCINLTSCGYFKCLDGGSYIQPLSYIPYLKREIPTNTKMISTS